jgi:RNA polymerase sigma-70 factor (ECF subfamily)
MPAKSQMDELELLQQALAGDLEAWGEMVTRYKRAVFGIALGILGNPADAEDATQDAFIRAYENLRRYDLRRRFSTWIFTIVSNICKNRLRQERFTSRLEDETQVPGGADPALAAVEAERGRLIKEALSELDFKYRAPLVLRYYSDLDYQEIAQILGLPEGTVKTHLHRGKAELKKILERKGVRGYE